MTDKNGLMLSALRGNETLISEETPPEYISFSMWSFGVRVM